MPSADASPPPSSRLHLVAAVALTGVAAGLGAAALSWLIHMVQHLAYGHSEAQMRIVTDGTTSDHRLWALLAGGLVVALGWTCLQLKGRPVATVSGERAARRAADRGGGLRCANRA